MVGQGMEAPRPMRKQNTTTAIAEHNKDLLRGAADDLRHAESQVATALCTFIDAGEKLAAVKAAIPHGGWLPALEAAGINPRTAQRAILIHSNQGQIRHSDVVFDTLTQRAALGADRGDTRSHGRGCGREARIGARLRRQGDRGTR